MAALLKHNGPDRTWICGQTEEPSSSSELLLARMGKVVPVYFLLDPGHGHHLELRCCLRHPGNLFTTG